jgi:hypothetical protein
MNLPLINEQLNLPDTELITKSGDHIMQLPNDVDPIEYDYSKTRNNLHSLLSQGQDALNYALEVAKQSENARAFEVVGNIIKQLADINHQLLDISEKKQRLTTKKPDTTNNNVTNNNAIFVGSTTDLTKMLKQFTPI